MVLVDAAIRGAIGALVAMASPPNVVSTSRHLGQAVGWIMATATEDVIGAVPTLSSKTLISAISSLWTTVAYNATESKFYGTHFSLYEEAGTAFGSGAAMDALGGLVSGGSHLIK
ncbi:virulence plasmid b [Fusarium napiforme]|uniref:Virulence plasmid b n=1 Tax=Fusarium napiforme TaxID=42672 RepID=A0A8H5MTX8_9HYPO|nr:virulence plasmid b [Fusarium napiforme]